MVDPSMFNPSAWPTWASPAQGILNPIMQNPAPPAAPAAPMMGAPGPMGAPPTMPLSGPNAPTPPAFTGQPTTPAAPAAPAAPANNPQAMNSALARAALMMAPPQMMRAAPSAITMQAPRPIGTGTAVPNFNMTGQGRMPGLGMLSPYLR